MQVAANSDQVQTQKVCTPHLTLAKHRTSYRNSSSSLRVALTVDPEIPVPPRHYGGIERVVDVLVRGLVSRNHEVTLFANAASDVPCRLLPYPITKPVGMMDMIRNMGFVSWTIARGHFDLVHSFGRLGHIAPLLPLRLPKIMSYQRRVTPRSVQWGEILSRGQLHVTGCSRHLISGWVQKDNFHVIYNAVPLERYMPVFCVAEDAPLVYLGRITQIKGVHVAIDVAQRTGRRLIIAGNVPSLREDQHYFAREIQPYVDGTRIQYVGSVDDEQKGALLGKAAALILPLQWDEPFGIVMAEALACGTPVIGFRRGALPEIVQHAVTGFVCDSVEEIVAVVSRVNRLDRKACRRVAEERFSNNVLVDAYEHLYRELV